MPSWTTPATETVGQVLTSALLNTDLRDNPQYLYNILNQVQAQTDGVNIMQDADAAFHGLTVLNSAKTHYNGLWQAATQTAVWQNDSGKQVTMDGSGNMVFSGPLNDRGVLLPNLTTTLGASVRINGTGGVATANILTLAIGSVGLWAVVAWGSAASAAGSPTCEFQLTNHLSTTTYANATVAGMPGSGVVAWVIDATTSGSPVNLNAINNATTGNDLSVTATSFRNSTAGATGMLGVRIG